MSDGAFSGAATQEERVARSSQRLLRAAVELFAEQGFAGTTEAQIADRAGYSRSMVRVRFGSKMGLLESVLQLQFESRLVPSDDPAASGLDRAIGVVDAIHDLYTEDPQFLMAVLMINFEAISGMIELGPHVGGWLLVLERSIAEALRAGQADGSVKAGLDADLEGHHFVATGIGLSYRWCQQGANYDYGAAVRAWRERMREACAAGPRN